MHSLLHALNVGTLATWLSVAGFGTVGVIVQPWQPAAPAPAVTETVLFDETFTLGGESSPAADGSPAEPGDFAAPVETLPAPPELPELAEIEPLPAIPDLPSRTAASAQAPAQSRPAARTGAASVAPGRAGSAKPGGTASAMSNAARLAAGRMPSPDYPPEARRKGQTGTVVVQFAVDSAGRVTYANAAHPSPWPLLNQEAVRTVLRWRFPPGDFIVLERPIVFQLR